MKTKRDPKFDPQAGDILRFGGTFNSRYYEVLPPDPRFMASDISYICEGIEGQKSIRQWREWMRKAEVIRAVSGPG